MDPYRIAQKMLDERTRKSILPRTMIYGICFVLILLITFQFGNWFGTRKTIRVETKEIVKEVYPPDICIDSFKQTTSDVIKCEHPKQTMETKLADGYVSDHYVVKCLCQKQSF